MAQLLSFYPVVELECHVKWWVINVLYGSSSARRRRHRHRAHSRQPVIRRQGCCYRWLPCRCGRGWVRRSSWDLPDRQHRGSRCLMQPPLVLQQHVNCVRWEHSKPRPTCPSTEVVLPSVSAPPLQLAASVFRGLGHGQCQLLARRRSHDNFA